MEKNIIVWDFNGTILDDVELCVDVVNELLKKRNQKELTVEQYINIFDFPVFEYYKKVGFNFEKESFSEVANQYHDLFHPASLLLKTRQGVVDKINEFKQKGYKQIILSACNSKLLMENVNKQNIADMFDDVLGLNDLKATSKVQMAVEWFKSNNIKLENAVIIGDTTHDFEVSKTVGCDCVLVTGGHNDKKRLLKTDATVVDGFSDILF